MTALDDLLLEGDNCPLCEMGQMGIFVENCSCLINPPCSACTSAPLVCNKCGHEQEAWSLKMGEPESAPVRRSLTHYKTADECFGELPNGVFGCVKYPSPGGWGMTVRGKMPEGMTTKEVLKGCNISKYGSPHFKRFYDGEFLFTYNYD